MANQNITGKPHNFITIIYNFNSIIQLFGFFPLFSKWEFLKRKTTFHKDKNRNSILIRKFAELICTAKKRTDKRWDRVEGRKSEQICRFEPRRIFNLFSHSFDKNLQTWICAVHCGSCFSLSLSLLFSCLLFLIFIKKSFEHEMIAFIILLIATACLLTCCCCCCRFFVSCIRNLNKFAGKNFMQNKKLYRSVESRV